MKFEALVTAALLTAIIGFAIPAKAEPLNQTTVDRNVVAASNLSSGSMPLSNLKEATELQFTTYNPYPFVTVEGIVAIDRQHGIGCIVGSQSGTQDADGSVFCGSIDND